MGRHSCCIKQKLRKGLWSPEEDEKLYNYITRFGVGCWSTVPKLAGLQRCGKSCRLRWINYLRPDLKRGMFSQQEEDLIIRLHEVLGNRWAQIAAQLPGRTDNEIKNFWNSCLKKKLLKQGIDPNTHQPVIENEVKDHVLQQNNNNNGISYDSSSSSSSGVMNTTTSTTSTAAAAGSYINTFVGKPLETNSTRGYSMNKHVYDPFFLLDFQTNLDDPCGYMSSSSLNLNQYYSSSCQQSTIIRPPPPPNEFGTLPNNNNNIGGFMINSLPNLTGLDHGSMNTDTDTVSRMSMLENGTTASAAVSWDSENKLVDSVNYFQYHHHHQFINGIKIEEDVKPSPSPPPPCPCPWQESQITIHPENSGDLISNYPLTSLSAEDFCGANLDHVFNHI